MLSKCLILLVCLLGFGMVRAPFENKLEDQLTQLRLLPPELDIDTRYKIGQNAYAITLGGLRSTSAAMLNLEAFKHYSFQDWDSVHDVYQTITTLQPYSHYYWETAGWHLAYNAYSDYKDRLGLSPSYRRLRQRDYLEKGASYYEQGCQLNPNDWQLRRKLAYLWRSPYHQPDYKKAAHLYQEAIALNPNNNLLQREYLYTIIHLPEKKEEALEILQSLFQAHNGRLKYPVLRCLLFVFQNYNQLPPFAKKDLLSIWSSRQQALKELSNYYLRSKRLKLPNQGVLKTILELEKELLIPKKRQFLNTLETQHSQ